MYFDKLFASSKPSNSSRLAAAAVLALQMLLPHASAGEGDPDGGGASPHSAISAKPGYGIGKALTAGKRRLEFDIVELGTRFAFDEAPVDQNGFPAYGNPFITQGVIYPAGVVQADAEGNTNGVIVETDGDGNSVARPEFPDLVLGVWICRGTVFADEGFNIESGPTVHSDQLFDFHEVGEGFGRISFSTTGLELIDLGKAIQRAVTGGTGPYRSVRGEMLQTFVGVNASQGFSLRYRTRFR